MTTPVPLEKLTYCVMLYKTCLSMSRQEDRNAWMYFYNQLRRTNACDDVYDLSPMRTDIPDLSSVHHYHYPSTFSGETTRVEPVVPLQSERPRRIVRQNDAELRVKFGRYASPVYANTLNHAIWSTRMKILRHKTVNFFRGGLAE